MTQTIQMDATTPPPDREIVAIFPTADMFADAVYALQLHGVDRASLSVLATGSEEQGAALRKAGFESAYDLLDAPNVPRTFYTQPEDVATAKGAVVSTLIYVGAALGAGMVAATGALGIVPLMAGAIASGAAGGGIGAYLDHRFGGKHARYIKESLAHGGLVLWVHLGEADDEQAIIALLAANGSEAAHVQDVPRTTA